MNIDERIEKLTERHEALAQTVELLAIENRQLSGFVSELSRTSIQARRDISELTRSMLDLVTVVRAHETRIARIEDNR